jgi:hypothetical protein
MDSDFSHLYAQLGLRPGCSLAQLKQAYRRRVAGLHPDRRRAGASADGTELPQLITLYKQALRFHARHGRLPGGISDLASDAASRAAPAVMPSSPPPAADPPRAPPLPQARAGWLMAALLLLGIGVLWNAAESGRKNTPGTGADSEPVAVPTENAPDHLVVGLDMDAVFALQGEPTHQGGAVWEYGPSWVRFEEDRLVEWYSSPLYPLKTREPRVGSRQ